MPSTSSGAAKRPLLTQVQKDEFLQTGVLHAPGLVPRPAVEAMAERLWRELQRRWGISRDQPQTWTVERPTHLQGLKRSGAFAEMASPGVRALMDEVFASRGWTGPAHWGQAFLAFPIREAAWTVPHSAWHIDLAYPGDLTPWPGAIRLFVLLDRLEPGGGGTVYVAGSHRLAMQVAAAAAAPLRTIELKQAVKRRDPWLEALCSPGGGTGRIARFMHEGAAVDGIDLRVEEITGEAGDVFLMHTGVLHAAAANCRSAPRLMLAETVRAAAPAP